MAPSLLVRLLCNRSLREGRLKVLLPVVARQEMRVADGPMEEGIKCWLWSIGTGVKNCSRFDNKDAGIEVHRPIQ